ncbi:MAG: hypothetical protein HQL72_04140 [Magnetococcales bacterium]|nr:hypothetical protein [Magnetococcales bacterium]
MTPMTKFSTMTGKAVSVKGPALGAGLGLGACWGPVLIVVAVSAAGFGVYKYLEKKRGLNPFEDDQTELLEGRELYAVE